MSVTLFVVATPIGNLDDLSPRARQTLAAVDLIAAEDTRHTKRLLSHFGIKTRLLALHDYNEKDRAGALIAELLAGRSVALVSDAGTPLISDPGYRVVLAAHEAGIPVSPVPGPSALVSALSVSGLPTDRFCFEGFLPAKSVPRRALLRGLSGEPRTLVFFEAIHRLAASLTDLEEILGRDRRAFIGREMTKLHEQCLHATLGQLVQRVADDEVVLKGEVVLVVEGSVATIETAVDADRLLRELAASMPNSEAARIAARATGLKRNDLYRRLLQLEGRQVRD